MRITNMGYNGKLELTHLTVLDTDGKEYECEPVRHGYWTEVYPYRDEDGYINYSYRCSVCEKIADDKTPYCPNCGAKMDVK